MNNLIVKEYMGNAIEFKMVDGMVYANANAMAKGFGGSSKIADWKRSVNTKRYLEAMENSHRVENPILSNDGVDAGTWIHEKLVLHFARYCNVEFEIWCDEQITTLIREGEVAINTPKTYKEALIALVEAEEVKERLLLDIKEKDDKIEDLEITLDEANDWASIKRVEMITGGKYSWRDLKRESIRIGMPIKSVFDANYGSVKSYHKEAWLNMYGVNIREF